ncbi:serine hydrolase [Pseudotabrizicola sp. 4114]|uniref:serine hydrolase domain-containing protein n=1 Tax=Pseudotabrizicola sp. 4114 TaxID=2817731 RepID=UPI002867452E|nr:CubicO group peptidase (beta-lactamase class C family) [Pseudorhodobacter sp. 4114]
MSFACQKTDEKTNGRVFPKDTWQPVAHPEQHGITPAFRADLDATLEALPTTSFIAVSGGETLYTYGDVSEVSYLASTRKSILSMLMGNAVCDGRIDLDLTIGDLGIEEEVGLLPIEKSAKLRDLLISSSGVYHPAGSPGGDMKDVPARGSKTPGEYFHYNNWDFNVLGAAFEKLTGRSVFAALEEDLALPLRFQDFDRNRQRMLGYNGQSRYLAYHLFLSGRDMARIGLLMARGGTWGDRQIVPAEWVAESTQIRVPAHAMNGSRKQRVAGYSYLWWIPVVTPETPEWQGAFVAAGHFGQFILGLPMLDMVVVNRRAISDEMAIARNNGTFTDEPATVKMEQFLAVADKFIAARRR